MEHASDKKFRIGISIATLISAYFIPTVGISSYHNIEQELTVFFPYLILIYLSPTAAFQSYELKIVPIWLTFLLFIPTFYLTREAYNMYQSHENQVLKGLKIMGAAVIQIFILFSSYLSEIDESRSFIPYSFLIIIIINAIAVAKWHITASKAALENA